MISVPFPMTGPGDSEVDRYLEEHGWRLRNGAAIVMTAPPELIADAADGPAGGPAGGTAERAAMTLASTRQNRVEVQLPGLKLDSSTRSEIALTCRQPEAIRAHLVIVGGRVKFEQT